MQFMHVLSLQDWEEYLGDDGSIKLATMGAVTKAEAVLLILVFFYTHGLPLNALSDLVTLINTLFGFEAVPRSVHKLRRLISGFSSTADFNFFCPTCSILLCTTKKGSDGGRKLWCSKCETWCPASIGKGDNYFVTLSIAEQLKCILKKFGSYVKLAPSVGGRLSDIRDGRMLQSMITKLGSPILSLLFSTDGSPVFKSSGLSLWPIVAFLNELPSKLRFKVPILAGIWCSAGPVPMSLYFDSFVTELGKLKTQGITWLHGGSEIVSQVFAVCACPDTLGRSSLQNLIRFNGFYGCSWCLHPGRFLFNQVRYPTLDTESTPRLDESLRADAVRALRSGATVNGVKGPSCLFNLPHFDLVLGFVPDYMHCVCLGVVKMMTEMWLSSKNHAEQFYIGQKRHLSVISSRLATIKPPNAITRLPRPITVRKDWKASEWRAWLLFYCTPSLTGILEKRYLVHFSLLSSAVYLLLQDSVTGDDISKADAMLFEFVVTCEILYGQKAMTSNVHQLLHLAESVRCWGPLWAHSAFPFEDWNGRLVKLAHGTRSVAHQILERFSMLQAIEAIRESVEVSPHGNAFCTNALGRKQRNSGVTSCGGTTGLGGGTLRPLSQPQKQVITKVLPNIGDVGTFFTRVVHDGMLYCTSGRIVKRADCYAALGGGECMELTSLVLVKCGSEDLFLALGKLLRPCPATEGSAFPDHVRIMSSDEDCSLVAIRTECMKGKCIAVPHRSDSLAVSVIPSVAWGD